MQILLIHQHYYPELGGTAKTTTEIAEYLAENGHQVTVISEYPNRGFQSTSEEQTLKTVEIRNKVKLYRLKNHFPYSGSKASRIMGYLHFTISSFFKAIFLRRTFDVCITVQALPAAIPGATGQLKATVPVGDHPTGAATAEDGKIWVTNLSSNNVMRVDPATNAVDFTHEGHPVPYNYSDMTGIISRSITTRSGTWTVVYQEASLNKATVSWTADTPSDSTLTVMAESSVDGVTWSTPQQIQSSVEFNTVANATRIRLVVEFNASTGNLQSPILYDLTVDTPAPTESGILQFSSANYSVNENGGSVTITVNRVGGSSGAISANYTSSDGTATVGSDYTQTTGTLNWDDGDSSEKTFTVPIIDDGNSEGPETFTLSLSDPVSGENLDNATVTIQDNDTTLVTLLDFTATALETEILLEWQTGDESDNAGFRIWRATGEGWKYGDYSTVIILNDQLIPADGGSGASYSYIDDNVESGLTYYYLLEDVDNLGVSSYHFDAIDSATP